MDTTVDSTHKRRGRPPKVLDGSLAVPSVSPRDFFAALALNALVPNIYRATDDSSARAQVQMNDEMDMAVRHAYMLADKMIGHD